MNKIIIFKVGDWVKFKLRKNYPIREIEYIRNNGNLILKNEQGDFNPEVVTLFRKSSLKTVIDKVNQSPKRTELSTLIESMGWTVEELLSRSDLGVKF